MKTKNYKRPFLNYVVCLLIAMSFNSQSFGQSPDAISYQGVARDAEGAILPLQAINLEYIIHDLTATGTVVFMETHNVTTTPLGLFNLNIGLGTPGTGTLGAVDWGNGAKFIEVVLDGTSMGTTQLNSVPYALYAGSSDGDFVDLTTDQTIAGAKTFDADAIINGVTIGKGAGSMDNNTAMGASALISNTTGDFNSAYGTEALLANTTGKHNSAYGPDALKANTVGNYNSAYGRWSLLKNIDGEENSAYGIQSLFNNTTGSLNTAFGGTTLYHNTTGKNNTAIGNYAGHKNITGNNNTFLGWGARATNNDYIENATAIGYLTEVIQSNSLILGNNADVGIGTSTPSAKLDVVGNIKITDGTEGAGKVLTSDATGVASWQTGNSGGVTVAEYNALLDRIDALETRFDALEPEPQFTGSLGDVFEGGTVFYIFQPGDQGYVANETHGFIASPDNLTDPICDGFQPWMCNNNGPNNFLVGTGYDIGDGVSNTAAIIAAQGANSSAAQATVDYSGGGFTDWFLPSVEEYRKMSDNQVMIANNGQPFLATPYWTSTEFDANEANLWFFSSNNNGFTAKAGGNFLVRPIRSF